MFKNSAETARIFCTPPPDKAERFGSSAWSGHFTGVTVTNCWVFTIAGGILPVPLQTGDDRQLPLRPIETSGTDQ
jgi:hypothetical protein